MTIWNEIWGDSIEHRCPRCEAEPGYECRNKRTGELARMPCVARSRVADGLTPGTIDPRPPRLKDRRARLAAR